ncbi:AP-5 complex subunit, vesicle trafficking, putative [Hepatocystis sp. ex Piliocolobus tephrosceles]|nr:AP-5 complex subunit, vesicle trafficking, putative [Hepatocystis sp. ex Piliocolobus tephrosceles]
MDIQTKLCEIKKLLELQTLQKDETKENLLNFLRTFYLIYMSHKTEDTKNMSKNAKEQKKIILRLLLVHVDSENHTHNGEKILMINLINLIEKNISQLFSYYPNIWKGYNSFFFFYILPLQYEYGNLNNIFFTNLQNSNNAYKNMHISLLLLNSNDFSIKIKTLKYIFYKYVMRDANVEQTENDKKNDITNDKKNDIKNDTKNDIKNDKKNDIKNDKKNDIKNDKKNDIKNDIKNDKKNDINNVHTSDSDNVLNFGTCEKTEFVSFLVGQVDSLNVEEQMSCFCFSLIPHLIRRDYVMMLKERQKKSNENDLVFIKKQLDKQKLNPTKNKYMNNLIYYSLSKNIFYYHFKQLENNYITYDNLKNDKKKNITKNNFVTDKILEKEKKNCNQITKNNNYYQIKNCLTNNYDIINHYNEDFLKNIFLYVKTLIENYEKKKNILNDNINEVDKGYICCFIINCISILINICHFNKKFINHSYQLIKRIKNTFFKYINASIIVSITEFVLFFSNIKDFVQVSNYLFIHFMKEYKNYLTAITFFNFIMKNINILKQSKFFFKKYFSLILKTYFYHYRIFKNNLTHILPYLIYENNYKDLLYFLLYAPLLTNEQNVAKIRNIILSKKAKQKIKSHNNLKETSQQANTVVLVQDLDNLHITKEDKNKKKIQDLIKHMHKYLRIYFQIILSSNNEMWIKDITKIVLYKLSCNDILEMLSKKSIKEILKSLNNIINNNSKILLFYKKEFMHLLQNKSDYYFLINRKILEMMANNFKYINMTYDNIKDYYLLLNSFFSNEKLYELKLWLSLIHAFTNIALYCHDLSNHVLNTYQHFLQKKNIITTVKCLIIENISIIKNVTDAKNAA